MSEKDFWRGCKTHDEWQKDCTPCQMNKDVYENYEMYKAMGEV